MKPEELLQKLKPIEPKTEGLKKAYLVEDDWKGKQEIESAIQSIAINKLKDEAILLPPPELPKGELQIGQVIYNEQEMQTFSIKQDTLCRHIAFFGTTGSGKTNSVFLLIANLLRQELPFLIFDFKKNYRDMKNTEAGKEIKVYTPGQETSPFFFNPLIPPKGMNPKLYINKLIDVLNHSHFVSYGVDHLLQTAIDEVYRKCGLYDEHQKGIPTFQQVKDWLEKYQARGRESLWKSSALRTVHDLCFGPVGEVFNSNKSIDIQNLLKQKAILELDALPQTTKTFLIESLLLQIYLYRMKEKGRDEKLKHLLIIEEAHHILLKRQQQQEETITDIFLRELREMGQGVCIIDQSPSMISNVALANINTIIALQLRFKDDIKQISKALLLKYDEEDYFGKLKIGQAIVKIAEAPEPFLLQIPLVPIKKGNVSDEEIKASSNRQDFRDFSLKTPQIAEPSRISPLSDSDNTEEQLLRDVFERPFSATSERYERLSKNPRTGNDAKEGLIQKSLVKATNVYSKAGKISLLYPTPEGITHAQKHGLRPKYNTSCGIIHEYWKEKIAQFYKAKGLKVTQEVLLDNGHRTDIIVNNGKRIAVEIETGKSDFNSNIRNNLEAGFDEVIVVATLKRIAERIKDETEKAGIKDERVRVVDCYGFS